VIAEVTAALDTCNDAAICGSDGSRMLVASVPVAASAASTAICAELEAASGRGAADIVEMVWSAMGTPSQYGMTDIILNGSRRDLGDNLGCIQAFRLAADARLARAWWTQVGHRVRLEKCHKMRSAYRIELRLSSEAQRKTSSRDEYFADPQHQCTWVENGTKKAATFRESQLQCVYADGTPRNYDGERHD